MDELTGLSVSIVHSENTNRIGGGGETKIVLTYFIYQPICYLCLSHDTAPGKKHEAKTAQLYPFVHLVLHNDLWGSPGPPHGCLLAELGNKLRGKAKNIPLSFQDWIPNNDSHFLHLLSSP